MPTPSLLTADIQAKLPPLHATETQADPLVQAKFFTPDAHWTWYAISNSRPALFALKPGVFSFHISQTHCA